jgi:hypothetical protein
MNNPLSCGAITVFILHHHNSYKDVFRKTEQLSRIKFYVILI